MSVCTSDQATLEFKQPTVASQAIVEFTDSKVEQAWSEADGSLLVFAETRGFNPEFDCRSGQCSACKTTLASGAVSYQTESPSSLEDNEILLCCTVRAAVENEDVTRLAIQL